MARGRKMSIASRREMRKSFVTLMINVDDDRLTNQTRCQKSTVARGL